MANGCCDGAEILAGLTNGRGRTGLRFALAAVLIEGLASARQSVSLGVNQSLDLQGQLYVATAVKPLPGSTLAGFQLRKLGLPEAQNISLDAADAGDIADFEIKTIRDYRRLGDALS